MISFLLLENHDHFCFGWLDELQAGIKITGRENKLRHGNDITLIAENEEELNSLLIRVKEESEKAGLKQHSKN